MFMVLFVGVLPVSARFNDKGTLRRARQIATGCVHVPSPVFKHPQLVHDGAQICLLEAQFYFPIRR